MPPLVKSQLGQLDKCDFARTSLSIGGDAGCGAGCGSRRISSTIRSIGDIDCGSDSLGTLARLYQTTVPQ